MLTINTLNITVKDYFRELFGSFFISRHFQWWEGNNLQVYRDCTLCLSCSLSIVAFVKAHFFRTVGLVITIGLFCIIKYLLRLASSLVLSFKGLLCDLLWSDPDKDVQGWGENDRGVSFTFGADVVSKFLNRHDLDLICRAHQV